MKKFLPLLFLFSGIAAAQTAPAKAPDASKWFEKLQIKGYAQVRYNRLGETNRDLKCSSCDKSVGDKQNLFLRRARLTFFGDVTDRVFVYIQPDYASDANSNQNYFQIRDAYFDYSLSSGREWRVRTGISKVPFGFENLQSSSIRAALDRNEALNSAVSNERDTGIFLMFTPTELRKRYKELSGYNLKGSGDYGMFAIGVYNGQTLNKPEKNNDLHRVVRFSYPFQLQSGQYIEASLQAYEGKYNTYEATEVDVNHYDQRSAASLIYYPQPFGFQLEYNVGQGPEYDPDLNTIRTQDLRGGYAQLNYNLTYENHRFFPFVRYQEYQGGRKLDVGSPSYDIREWEFGTEWQPDPAFELTVAYNISDREIQSDVANKTDETGSLVRLQAQFNY